MMNTVIIDAYHDSDRGGAGILAGVVDSLTEECNLSESELAIVYRFSQEDSRYKTAARHTQESYPDASINGQTLDTSWETKSGLTRVFFALYTLFISVPILIYPSLSKRESINNIKEAEQVISKGGHFYQFHEDRTIYGFLQAYYMYYSLLLSVRLGKEVHVFAHSFGPFSNIGSRILTRFIFARVNSVHCREPNSQRRLSEIGIDDAGIVPDTAFRMSGVSEVSVDKVSSEYELEQDDYCVVTARQWDFPGYSATESKCLYEEYLQSLAELTDYVVGKGYVDKVALVVHNDGQHLSVEDDAQPIERIANLVNHDESTVVIDKDLSPREQSRLYGNAKLMIGTRMHSVIFAFVGGAPAMAVGYTHKTNGIMRMAGLENYVVPIDRIGQENATEVVDKIINEHDILSDEVDRIVKQFRDQIDDELIGVV